VKSSVSTDLPLSVADAEWFQRPELQKVFSALNSEGHEARIVGGALRNTLMDLPIGDVDFAVTAEPEEMMRLAEAAGLKTVPTGLSHGTVTIVVEGIPFEATTLRHDVETDGRFAKVAFTREWAADASRRDFTINALYADADGRVYDPLGEGIADIRACRIRFIGRAIDRIHEDYLRILRFFRFTAEYSRTDVDPDGLAACIEGKDGLTQLSAERVRTELLRILAADNPMLALEAMAESGIQELILGGKAHLPVFARLAAIEAHLDLHAYPVRRLAALAVDGPDDAKRLAKGLKLSNAEALSLKNIAARAPDIKPDLSLREQREALYRLGREIYVDCVLMAWSRSDAPVDDDGWLSMIGLPRRWPAPEFAISGEDLIARGFKPGPALGKTLRELEERWIASDFKLARDELLTGLE
jgi:tRNA nucleotidyltransferase/poly(A) polymerase